MARIKELEISCFRGVQELKINGFSDINLIVGDNNSGKTTLLEALQLLFVEPSLGSIKNVINYRTILNTKTNSFYSSFIKMFNTTQNKDELHFSIRAESERGTIKLDLNGAEKSISGEDALQLSKLPSRQKKMYKSSLTLTPETARVFSGSITHTVGNSPTKKAFQCTSLDVIPVASFLKGINYIPSFGHLRYDLLKNIVNNQAYKELAISILKQFDDSISDICYTLEDDGTFLETIITNKNVKMPFSVYGDGIKKILYILNKMFEASDSILLIDEIETGLHKQYYDRLFPVIFALAHKLNIQLFIATHNIEVIDSILKYADYDSQNENDPIRVITLKKIKTEQGSNLVARNVTGKYVYDNRKVFDFEVRL